MVGLLEIVRARLRQISFGESPLSLSSSPSPVSMADLDAPQSKTRDLDKLLLRAGNLVGPDFYPGAEVNAFYYYIVRLLLFEGFLNFVSLIVF